MPAARSSSPAVSNAPTAARSDSKDNRRRPIAAIDAPRVQRRTALLNAAVLATRASPSKPASAALIDAAAAQRVFASVSPSIVAIGEVRENGEVVSRGSGVCWATTTDACYVVTNAHCLSSSNVTTKSAPSLCLLFKNISGSDQENVQVVLSSKSLLYSDAARDVGFVRVDVNDFPKGFDLPRAAAFGSSANLLTGQGVFALACAPDGARTLHGGVISGLRRKAPMARGGVLSDLIQTDASVSESSSGGALCDSNGRVIGMLTSIGGVNGVNFAIPIDVARLVAEGTA